jgi:hypothetical protein
MVPAAKLASFDIVDWSMIKNCNSSVNPYPDVENSAFSINYMSYLPALKLRFYSPA